MKRKNRFGVTAQAQSPALKPKLRTSLTLRKEQNIYEKTNNELEIPAIRGISVQTKTQESRAGKEHQVLPTSSPPSQYLGTTERQGSRGDDRNSSIDRAASLPQESEHFGIKVHMADETYDAPVNRNLLLGETRSDRVFNMQEQNAYGFKQVARNNEKGMLKSHMSEAHPQIVVVEGKSGNRLFAAAKLNYEGLRSNQDTEVVQSNVDTRPVSHLTSKQSQRRSIDDYNTATGGNETVNSEEQHNDTAMTTLHLKPVSNDTGSNSMVILFKDKSRASGEGQILLYENARDLGIKNVSIDARASNRSRKSLTVQNSIYSKDDSMSLLQEPVKSTKKISKDQKLTQQALDDYMKKKQRLMRHKRVFNDDSIATIDEVSQKRTSIVARLLGGSKEAQDIQNQFRQMIEVPQEDFSIDKFKQLNTELKIRVQKPNKIYEEQLRKNPRHIKKLTTIEDFVTILPTSAESMNRLSEKDFRTYQDIEDVGSSIEEPIVIDYSSQPEQLLAIANDSSEHQRLSAPYIQALHSNLSHSVQMNDQQDENTFITNMVGDDDDLYEAPQSPSLPIIKPVKDSNRRTNMVGKHTSGSIQLYANEYQLKTVGEIDASSVQDYRSVSSIIKNSEGTNHKSNQHRKGSQMMKPVSSMSIMPHSRSKLQREPSELSFSLGKARNVNSKMKSKRILGERSSFQHSQLSSALGRESRVLKKIYQRVNGFEKKEVEGKRLGYTQGMVELYSQIKREKGAKSAAMRGHKAPLRPIFVGQNKAKINPRVAMSLDPIQDNQIQTVSIIGGGRPSAATLADSRTLTQNDGDRNSQHLVIVDSNKYQLPKDVPLKAQSHFETLNSVISEPKSLLKPWEGSKDQLQVQKTIPIVNKYQQPQPKDSSIELIKTRDHDKTVLNQYKQRRTLVSNLQVSKLIKKDMKMFTGSEDRPKRHALEERQSMNPKTITGLQPDKNPLLDDPSSDEKVTNLNDLVNIPLGSAAFIHKDSSQDTLMHSQTKLDQHNFSLPTYPAEGDVSNLPSASRDQQLCSERQQDLGTVHISNTSRIHTIKNQYENLTDQSIPIEPMEGDLDVRNHSSMLSSVAIKSTPGKMMQARFDKRQQSNYAANDVNSYYRHLNNQARNNSQKLQKVVIRGTNFGKELNPNKTQNSADQMQNSFQDQTETQKAQQSDEVIKSVDSMVKNNRSFTKKPSMTPISVHLANPLGAQVINDDQIPDNVSQSTSPIKRDSVTSNFNQERQMRSSKEDGFVNLQSSQSIKRGRLLSIANEVQNVANTDQKQNENNLKLMNGTAGQHSSALGSFWNDPYGASQNDQKFAAMYKESFEFQPSNVSASKESLNLKLQNEMLTNSKVVITHKVNIVSPFVNRDTNGAKKMGRRAGSVEGVKMSNKVKPGGRGQQPSLQQQKSSQGIEQSQSTLKHTTNQNRNNENSNVSTVTAGRSEAKSGLLQGPNTIPMSAAGDTSGHSKVRRMSQINMNANVNLQNMQNISDPANQYDQIPHNQQVQLIHEETVSEQAVSLPRATATFDGQMMAPSKGTMTMNQTKNTLFVQSQNNQGKTNQESNSSIKRSSVEDLAAMTLPKINIKMVLTEDSLDSEIERQYTLGNPDESAKMYNDTHESKRLVTHGSHIVLTEGSNEPPLKVVTSSAIMQRSVKSRTSSKETFNKSNQARGRDNTNGGYSRSNLDLLPVISSNAKGEQRTSRKSFEKFSNERKSVDRLSQQRASMDKTK